MAAIGDAWATDAWVEAGWVAEAWDGGGGGVKRNMPIRQVGHLQAVMRGFRSIILILLGA